MCLGEIALLMKGKVFLFFSMETTEGLYILKKQNKTKKNCESDFITALNMPFEET